MKVRRHPVLGVFSGLLLGLGAAIMLVLLGIVPMTVMWIGIVTAAGVVVGIALAYALPARGAARAGSVT
jgi:hypothetical protein